MGGEIGVNSTPGLGTAFSFTACFPVVGAESEGTIDSQPAEHLPKRVLVVEDNPINQIVTRRLLQNMGHQATIVADGASTITEVQASAYDLVLMDLHMRDLDGREVTRQIRNLGAPCADVPIVALTAARNLSRPP
jgi:two-component system, sensor histidine kinase